jgi:hypothetical protein
MYEALPMYARIEFWEGKVAAQHGVIARLTELAALQLLKLNKTKDERAAAEDDLATQQRKLRELAEEQASWGPGTDLAAPEVAGGAASWDGYVWDYHDMCWKWQDDAQSWPAALPHAAHVVADPQPAVTDPYLVVDAELQDHLLQFLGQVHEHAPHSRAWALAEGLQMQSSRHAALNARVKLESGAAAPSPTPSQVSTVAYSQHPFKSPTAAAPVAAGAAAAAPCRAAPSLQARAKGLPRATGTLNAAMRRLVPAKRGGHTVMRRVGVASPARSSAGVVNVQKLQFGAAETVIIDDAAMDADADGEGFVADLVDGPTGARPAAFPQAAGEAAAALA